MNLSKQLQVPQAKGIITYKHIRAGLQDPDNPNRMTSPAGENVPNIDTIYDPFDEEEPYKIMKYVRSTGTDVNGNLTELLGDIDFVKPGFIYVDAQRQRNLYIHMERSNFNGSNPYRDTTKPIIFTKVDKVRTAKEEKILLESKDDAVAKLRELNATVDGKKELVSFYASTGGNPLDDADLMYTNIRKMVEANPDAFLSAIGSEKTKIKSDLAAAVTAEMIEFLDQKSQWIWKKERTEILPVARGLDKNVALYDFVVGKKGTPVLKEIRRRLEA